jgi:hypothetical protein
VTIAGAIVTFGGVSLFVALFVIVPMAQGLFMAAGIPRRLVPATVALGTMTFTMSALPETPALQNAIPMPFFGTTLRRDTSRKLYGPFRRGDHRRTDRARSGDRARLDLRIVLMQSSPTG